MSRHKRQQHQASLNLVARLALSQAEALPTPERIQLFEGLALILPEAEAKQAGLTAFALREFERQQMKFRDLFPTA